MLDYRQLDRYQRKAVLHGEGPLLVIAGPGSGKTFTLIHRILFLLQKGISPSNILMITYTNEAAQTMRARFQSFCTHDVKDLFIGTFHSFFYHILIQHHLIPKNSILTSLEKLNIILSVLPLFLDDFSAESRRNEVAHSFLQAMEYYKNSLDMEGACLRFDQEYRDVFPAIFDTYEKMRYQSGKVDFDDMQYHCFVFLRDNPKERERLQHQYLYILVDEFQDINPVQYEILKLLSGKFCNTFAVGDDDQAIYGFRGAAPDIMTSFLEDFYAKQIQLRYNYRSEKDIVVGSLRLIQENHNRLPKKLQAQKQTQEKGSVVCKQFFHETQQNAYMVGRIQEELKQGHSCAVLFRTNRHLQKFINFYKEINDLCSLLTVHGAKGLEFDTVFIPNCNEGVFPYGWERKTEETEEERRIFYVAVTRAKKCLELLTLKGTSKSPRQISNYLTAFIPQPTRRIRNCPGTHQKHLQQLHIRRHRRYSQALVLRWGRRGFHYICKTIPRHLHFLLFHPKEEEQCNLYHERE